MKSLPIYFLLSIVLIFPIYGKEGNWEVIKVIKGFDHPESVVFSEEGDAFFVSNLGKKLTPTEKDGDGYISKISLDGEVLDHRFFPKTGVLHAPKGMGIQNGILYTTDVDRLIAFQIDGKKIIQEWDFSKFKTKFLNDLTLDSQGNLFITSSDIGVVFKIDSKQQIPGQIFSGLPWVNGILSDKKDIYFVARGVLYKFQSDTISMGFHKLAEFGVSCDGIVKAGNQLIISDWSNQKSKNGKLFIFDIQSNRIEEMRISESIKGSADLGISRDAQTLAIPVMLEKKVILLKKLK